MKKKLIALVTLLALMVATVSASGNIFELTQVHYPIYTNYKLVPEDDLPILSYNDRTYVPLRKLSEASGLSVLFDETSSTIHIQNQTVQQVQIYSQVMDAAYLVQYIYMNLIYFDNSCDLALNAFDGYQNEITDNCLRRTNSYVYTIIPNNLEILYDKIYYLEEMYTASGLTDVLGESPIDRLFSCYDSLVAALHTAEVAYDFLYNYINNNYTKEYFYSQYSGEGGIYQQLFQHMNDADNEASLIYNEFYSKIQDI